MSFDANRANQEALDRAWVALEGMDRGDLFEHTAIEAAFRVRRPDIRYYQLISRLNRRMEEQRGIALINNLEEGYRLAMPDEQLDLGAVRARRAARQIRRGAKSVGCLPDAGLDMNQARKKAAAEARLERMDKSIRQDAILLALLNRPRELNPRLHLREDEAVPEAM